MLRNKDRQLAGNARVQSQNIAFNSNSTDRAAGQLQMAGQDFCQWVDDMTDERLIEKIPNLIERLDYIYPLVVEVQGVVVKTILEIHGMRETLEKLATRKTNREKEEANK
ncbi:MAG: hypothetical protein E6121_05050 [Varibaculum cambriense]|nr:hypothetical protein [Varibaculum cambriense]